jgi:hypothetical protein
MRIAAAALRVIFTKIILEECYGYNPDPPLDNSAREADTREANRAASRVVEYFTETQVHDDLETTVIELTINRRG